MANSNPERQLVLMSGLPGKVATLVAEGVHRSPDLVLSPFALSSERHGIVLGSCKAIRNQIISLQPPSCHRTAVERIRELGGIIVDFTNPNAANPNAELYAQVGVPFVMGTSGGDRQKLVETVKQSRISAVIAPNMATPMIIIQAMLEYAARTFPNTLQGWDLIIEESHQDTKRDVSETARAWRPLLETLGTRMLGEIVSIRNRAKQVQIGVMNLNAHAYHKVRLVSPTEDEIELNTRINGRDIYVGGTLQAIRFLAEKVRSGSQGEVFSMVDVLKG